MKGDARHMLAAFGRSFLFIFKSSDFDDGCDDDVDVIRLSLPWEYHSLQGDSFGHVLRPSPSSPVTSEYDEF